MKNSISLIQITVSFQFEFDISFLFEIEFSFDAQPKLSMSRLPLRERFFIAAWFECYGSVSIVQRKFRDKFGRSAQLPCRATMNRIHNKAVDTGELGDAPRSGRNRSFDDIELVAEHVAEKPDMSVREICPGRRYTECWRRIWICTRTRLGCCMNFPMKTLLTE